MKNSVLVIVGLISLLAVFCSIATATDRTVFGIALGEKFSIPECERNKYLDSYDSLPVDDKVCFEKIGSPSSEIGEPGIVHVRFPHSQAPLIIEGREMTVILLDGNPECIEFLTAGISNAEMVMEKLKEKYGEPSALVPKKVQNRFGATFDAFDAVWNLQDLFVSFQSATGFIDSGIVKIDTKKGKEFLDRDEEKRRKKKIPL
jgi:hypothetical protein